MRTAVKAGVIGARGIGAVHVDALRRIGVDVAGVASSSVDLARDHADRLGIDTAYPTAHDLIDAPDIEAVHICTPNATHFHLAHAAISAGKHVICEKPLACSVDEARELEVLAERTPTVNAVCYVYRFFPMVQVARARVQAGDLGKVHLISGTYFLDFSLVCAKDHWCLDPDVMGPSLTLSDVGIHWCDLVEYVAGARIVSVMCASQSIRVPGQPLSEDSAAIILRLENGAIAVAAICEAAAGHNNQIRLELIGDRASGSWVVTRPDELRLRRLGGAQEMLVRGTRSEQDGQSAVVGAPPGHASGFLDAFRDLMWAIYQNIGDPGTQVDYPSFGAGVRSLEILTGLRRSSQDGCWVTVAA